MNKNVLSQKKRRLLRFEARAGLGILGIQHREPINNWTYIKSTPSNFRIPTAIIREKQLNHKRKQPNTTPATITLTMKHKLARVSSQSQHGHAFCPVSGKLRRWNEPVSSAGEGQHNMQKSPSSSLFFQECKTRKAVNQSTQVACVERHMLYHSRWKRDTLSRRSFAVPKRNSCFGLWGRKCGGVRKEISPEKVCRLSNWNAWDQRFKYIISRRINQDDTF